MKYLKTFEMHRQPDVKFSNLVHDIFKKFGRIKISSKTENKILDWIDSDNYSSTWLDNNWDDVVDYINARN